jgi:hypothetical protein
MDRIREHFIELHGDRVEESSLPKIKILYIMLECWK